VLSTVKENTMSTVIRALTANEIDSVTGGTYSFPSINVNLTESPIAVSFGNYSPAIAGNKNQNVVQNQFNGETLIQAAWLY
jgi:hypothetical protein